MAKKNKKKHIPPPKTGKKPEKTEENLDKTNEMEQYKQKSKIEKHAMAQILDMYTAEAQTILDISKNKLQRPQQPSAEESTPSSKQADKEDTKLVDTKIVDTNIGDTKIVDTNSVDTKKVDTKIGDTTKKVDTNLVGTTEIVDTNLVDTTKKVGTNSVYTKLVGTKIVGTKKVSTKKVDTEIVDTNSVDTKKVDTKLVGTKKVDTNSVGTNIVGTNLEDTQKDTVSTEGESTTFIQQLKVLAGNLAFFQVPYLVRTVVFSLAIHNEQFVFECSYRTLGEMFNLSPSNKARVYSIIKSLPGTRIIKGKAGTNTIVDLTAFVSKSFTEDTTKLVGTKIVDTKKVDTNLVGTKIVDTNIGDTNLGDTKKVDTKLVGAVSSSSYINNINNNKLTTTTTDEEMLLNSSDYGLKGYKRFALLLVEMNVDVSQLDAQTLSMMMQCRLRDVAYAIAYVQSKRPTDLARYLYKTLSQKYYEKNLKKYEIDKADQLLTKFNDLFSFVESSDPVDWALNAGKDKALSILGLNQTEHFADKLKKLHTQLNESVKSVLQVLDKFKLLKLNPFEKRMLE